LPSPETKKNGKEKEKNRSVERSISKTEKKRMKNRFVKEKLKQTVCCDFVVFEGHGVTAGREGQKRRRVFRSKHFLRCLQRRLDPHAASVFVTQKPSSTVPQDFCNFQISICIFRYCCV